MSDNKNYKDARDRFLAFSFAASDILIEVDRDGRVMFVAGQVQSLMGRKPEQMIDNNFIDLFDVSVHDNLFSLIKGVQRAGRIGPLMVSFKNHKNGEKNKALIMGMTVPNSESIYLTLTSNQAFFDFLAVGDYQETALLNEKQFEAAAMKAFQSAKKKGQNLDVTFLDAEQVKQYQRELSVEASNNFTENFQALLKEQSYDGNVVTQVDENKYAIVHDIAITPDFIETKIKDLVKRTSEGASEVSLDTKTIQADMDALNEREARRALIYTINQIEKGGLDSAGDDLALGFDDYLNENAAKIARLKKLVSMQAFQLHFQPIVYLANEDIAHYEALVRFSTDESPYELIVFGEDIGIAPEIDLPILKQAIGFVQNEKSKNPDIKVAVNISGQSIQNEEFFQNMIQELDETGVSPNNILFELTESTAIGDLTQVNNYIQQLRERKFEVCLDDFGAGAASFQYLNGLDIDCVKIDGKYIRDALTSPRDGAMVRNLVRMCQDLGITTVAEMVETEDQKDFLLSIGVDKAQGWLFGKPKADASYTKR